MPNESAAFESPSGADSQETSVVNIDGASMIDRVEVWLVVGRKSEEKGFEVAIIFAEVKLLLRLCFGAMIISINEDWFVINIQQDEQKLALCLTKGFKCSQREL
jgi:hypothetical protein